MPQTLAYFPIESGPSSLGDIGQLDDSKPETWPLSLPSSISEDERSRCYNGIVETKRDLRLAQLQDGLVDLRRFRRTLRNLWLYFKTNTAGEGQKTQTKSRTIEVGVNNRIKRAVCRYRIAYGALLELDPTGDWKTDYRELRDEDNRGPLKEFEERGTGDGRYAPSWIWAVPSLTPLGEGSVAEHGEVNETAGHEWMTVSALNFVLLFFPNIPCCIAISRDPSRLPRDACPTLHPPLCFIPHDPHDPNNSYDLCLKTNQSLGVYRDVLECYPGHPDPS